MNIKGDQMWVTLLGETVPIRLDKLPNSFKLCTDPNHAYWRIDMPAAEVMRQKDETPHVGPVPQFSEISSDEELEELDLPYSSNKRIKLHKYRAHIKKRGISSNRQVPNHVLKYMQLKRASEAEDSHRSKKSRMEVPACEQTIELYYSSDDSLKVDSSHWETSDDDEEMDAADSNENVSSNDNEEE